MAFHRNARQVLGTVVQDGTIKVQCAVVDSLVPPIEDEVSDQAATGGGAGELSMPLTIVVSPPAWL